jgi:aldehyde:ferredoxin oxidoreductase
MSWTGRLLRVDLTHRTSTVEPLGDRLLHEYLGGRGLGAKLLRDAGRHLLDPFDARAALVVAAGPLTGTRAPGSGRLSMSAVSPLTGTLFDSNSGGFFGLRLKAAGYDALWIEGVSTSPLCLILTPEGVRFEDASELWGLGNFATRAGIEARFGIKNATLTIGPAGETGSLLANIAHGTRFFGRGGLGSIFGQKKLKAVCIAESGGQVAPADPEAFDFVVEECKKLLAAHPITSKGLPQFGTSVLMNVMNAVEALPTRNYRESRFDGAERISGEAIRDRIASGRHACPACAIGCGRKVLVDGEEIEGPEFETLWAFGADLGVDDLEGIARINRLANDLGLDTVSAGSTVAAACELHDRGLLGWSPLEGGLPGVGKLLVEMASGEGRGAVLRHGSLHLGRELGAPEVSMTVKGLELPAYDPRGCQGQGLAYATSNRGGCHLRSYMVAPEILAAPKLIDRFASSGKAGLVIVGQNLNAAVDSLVLCRFTSFVLRDDYYARLLRAATGLDIDAQGLMTVGERIYNLERLANLERGFGRSDDTLPRRLLEECASEGPAAGRVVNLEPMLEEYYRFRGWDRDGRPGREKLASLNLGEGGAHNV